jgi:hypothetical protein
MAAEVPEEMLSPSFRIYRAFKHGHPGTGQAANSATIKQNVVPQRLEPLFVIRDDPIRKYVPQPVKDVENLVIEYLT